MGPCLGSSALIVVPMEVSAEKGVDPGGCVELYCAEGHVWPVKSAMYLPAGVCCVETTVYMWCVHGAGEVRGRIVAVLHELFDRASSLVWMRCWQPGLREAKVGAVRVGKRVPAVC